MNYQEIKKNKKSPSKLIVLSHLRLLVFNSKHKAGSIELEPDKDVSAGRAGGGRRSLLCIHLKQDLNLSRAEGHRAEGHKDTHSAPSRGPCRRHNHPPCPKSLRNEPFQH